MDCSLRSILTAATRASQHTTPDERSHSDHPPLDQPVDPSAPKTASQIAMESSHIAHGQDVHNRGGLVTDHTPGEDNFAMKAAGKLQGAMDLGAYDERFDATRDAATAAHEAYEMRSKVFDLVKDVVGEAPEVQLLVGWADL